MLCSQIGIKFSHLLESLFYCIDEAKVNVTGFQFFILKVGAASLWEVISSKQ